MATLQKSASSFLVGTLATSYLFLIALSVQGGTAAPIGSQCRLDKGDIVSGYINNITYKLADEASLMDNNTDVQLFGANLFQGVSMTEQCYLMKQVLKFTLAEVLLPQSYRFQPYMKEMVGILDLISNKLNQCHIESDNQHIQRKVQELKDTVRKLGESGEIKVISEVNFLLDRLKEACLRSEESWKMNN
ncbi:interleukin-22 isoform X2 [Talpa occidentalis]|uniref:interleukin-22 isoform X2 n=1 Tax=Talpa occidentalis TaxID=50954 RepID=UPI00188F2C04|nr:interleukin-22 isoform X2 [Talpa occidentalis]